MSETDHWHRCTAGVTDLTCTWCNPQAAGQWRCKMAACDQANPGHTHDTAWQVWQQQSLGDRMNDLTLASAERRVQQMATSYRSMPGQEMPAVGHDLQAVLDELARIRLVATAGRQLLDDIDRGGCVYDYEVSDDIRRALASSDRADS